jgi:hypothetical protein
VVEQIRHIYGTIVVDSNKRTEEFRSSAESVEGLLAEMKVWGFEHEFMADDRVAADPNTTPPQPERWLTGTRTFAHTVGRCPRCKSGLEVVLTVDVTVDLNSMTWNRDYNKPVIGANTRVVKSELVHECSDLLDVDDDEEDDD